MAIEKSIVLTDDEYIDIAERKRKACDIIADEASKSQDYLIEAMTVSETIYEMLVDIRFRIITYEHHEKLIKTTAANIVYAMMFTRMSVECYPYGKSLFVKIKLI
jgi:hypothetical protein